MTNSQALYNKLQALEDISTAGVRRGINACRDILRAEYLEQLEANNEQQYTIRRLLDKLDSLTEEEAEEF